MRKHPLGQWLGISMITLGVIVLVGGVVHGASLALSAEGLRFTNGLYPAVWWAVAWGSLIVVGIWTMILFESDPAADTEREAAQRRLEWIHEGFKLGAPPCRREIFRAASLDPGQGSYWQARFGNDAIFCLCSVTEDGWMQLEMVAAGRDFEPCRRMVINAQELITRFRLMERGHDSAAHNTPVNPPSVDAITSHPRAQEFSKPKENL